MLDDLRRLTNVNDGFMDDVHALRDAYKADLVALLVDPGNWGGIAWINSTAEYGFSVTAVDAVYYDAFQHELGHNWWMRHNPEEDGSSSPIP
jgi:peptidyl-Asp metalloendopeptidase